MWTKRPIVTSSASPVTLLALNTTSSVQVAASVAVVPVLATVQPMATAVPPRPAAGAVTFGTVRSAWARTMDVTVIRAALLKGARPSADASVNRALPLVSRLAVTVI